MQILVISDLHANWPALEAVLGAQAFDLGERLGRSYAISRQFSPACGSGSELRLVGSCCP